jgi:hypothetical protein
VRVPPFSLVVEDGSGALVGPSECVIEGEGEVGVVIKQVDWR